MDFRPKMLICGGSAYPREWDYKRLYEIAQKVGALLMSDMAHIRCASPTLVTGNSPLWDISVYGPDVGSCLWLCPFQSSSQFQSRRSQACRQWLYGALRSLPCLDA